MNLTLGKLFLAIFGCVIAKTESNFQNRQERTLANENDISNEVEDGKQMISVSVKLTFTNYPNPDIIPAQLVVAPKRTAAFEFLRLAAQLNPCYAFQYKVFDIGRYITTICGVKEKNATNFYWFIYINGRLSPVGADLLRPKNGDILKFEYQLWDFKINNNTVSTFIRPTSFMQDTPPKLFFTHPTGKGTKSPVPNFNLHFLMIFGILGLKSFEIL